MIGRVPDERSLNETIQMKSLELSQFPVTRLERSRWRGGLGALFHNVCGYQ
jgi:hypothetical protein